jgi:denticleless
MEVDYFNTQRGLPAVEDYSKLVISSEVRTQASSFSVSFSNNDPSLCCTCDEVGNIFMISMTESNEIAGINPHNNSVFHVGWSLDDKHVLSGSGDQTGGIWDVERDIGNILAKHTGSVKCIRNCPTSSSVYSTASRDGKIFIWDIRTKGVSCQKNTVYKPVGEISETSEISVKKRKDNVSFTGIEYMPWGNIIVSVQANEADMRFWDTRLLVTPNDCQKRNTTKNLLATVGPYTLINERKLKTFNQDKASELLSGLKAQIKVQQAQPGNSWVTRRDNSILVSSVSSCLYFYKNYLKIDVEEPVKLVGHRASFYVKGCISPDCRFVASGSSDGALYIWDVEEPNRPVVVDTGLGSELGCVDWTFGNSSFLATSLDSAVVLFWDF